MPKKSWDQLISDHPESAEAVAFFRERLGDDCVRNGAPLATTFMTAFQEGIPEGVRLYRLLRTLDAAERDDLVHALGGDTESDVRGAELTLRLVASWKTAGRLVRLIPRTNLPTPDLAVKLFDRFVTVECTCLNENDDTMAVFAFTKYAMNWAQREPGRLVGEFFAHATIDDLDAARAVLEEIRVAHSPTELEVPGAFRISYDPRGEKNHFPFMTAPSSRTNDLDRLRGKLKKKVTQLAPGAPNVLAIDVGDIFDLHTPNDVRQLLAEALRRYKRISAVVVSQTDLRPTRPPRRWHCGFFEGPTTAGLLRRGLMVHNPEGATRLLCGEILAFREAVFA